MTTSEFEQQLCQLAGLPVSEFVLHRKPALLLDTLISITSESAVCEFRVQHDHTYLSRGKGVPAYIGIECMAQCIAAHAGACERVDGFPPPIGLLLGTRHYQSKVPYFEPGASYRVQCQTLIRNSDGMGSFECCILSQEKIIVKARLAVLQMPRGASINA